MAAELRSVRRQRDERGHHPRPPLVLAREPLEEGIRLVEAGRPARRMEPGGAVERDALDAGVLAEDPRFRRRKASPELCFQESIFIVGRACLLGPLVGEERLDLPVRQGVPELVQLVAVARREHRAYPLSQRKRRSRLLEPGEVVDAGGGEIEQLVQPAAIERHPLGRRLHLDEQALARHHDVEVDVGGRVLGVLEVEQRLPVHHPDGDRRDGAGERAREPEPVEGVRSEVLDNFELAVAMDGYPRPIPTAELSASIEGETILDHIHLLARGVYAP